MSSENPFISPLGKLALSLGASDDNSAAAAAQVSSQLIQRRQLCVVTLLRIIDNILDDPGQVNPKLRKIKVNNPAFHKRCGQWDGSIDYLITCGFKMKGDLNNNSSSSSSSSSSRHLRLDADDHDMLLYGREMLVQFAVLTLGVDEKSLPECPTQVINQESCTDDDAKLADNAIKKSNGTTSITGSSSSAHAFGDDAATHRLLTTAQNETKEEVHSVVVANVVSNQTNDVAVVASHQEQARVIIKDGIIESTTIKDGMIEATTIGRTKAANSSLPPAAADDDNTLRKHKEFNQLESPSTEGIHTDKEADEEPRAQSNGATITQNDLISDEMTNLLNEIEAELNDDFFSTTDQDYTTTEEAVVLTGNSKISTTCSENSKDASPKEDSIPVKISEDTSNIDVDDDDEEDDELAMAIAMSLSQAASDKDENKGVDMEDNGESSNNRTLSHGEDAASPCQESDQGPPSMVEGMLQPSDTNKTLAKDTSLAKQENGIHDNKTEPPPISSDEPIVPDKDAAFTTESDKVEEQNVANLLSDLESDTKSPLKGTSREVSRFSHHHNSRTSALHSSISSEKTLQIRNTSIQPQDSGDEVVTEGKGDEATIELHRPPASDDGQISQSNDTQFDDTDVFRKIPIPEGEYASSNEEDSKTFRLGFELCHRSLFSIWLSSGLMSVSGLSNLHRQCRKDETNPNVECDPVIVVPLHLVYAVWTHILGLQSTTSHSTNDARQSGSLYSWIVSNNNELSTLDDLPIRKLSMNIHTNLSETNISVCNYVLNALREIEVIDIYGGNIIDSPSSDTTLFIGVERSVCEEYTTNNHRASSLLSEPIIRECHGILAQVVYPNVLDQLDNGDTAPNNHSDQTLLWYALHHAPRHLVAVSRISDAKELLLNSNFIRARVLCTGYLEGTRQHCKDCADLANRLSRSENDWKRTQLHAADTKQKECVMSPEDYDYHDHSQQAPELTEWKESRVKALCAVSNILREKVGQISNSNQVDDKVEIGNSLQVVGESIGDIGVYHVEELEHYDEALQLKSEALGDKHEEVAETLFAMGCHHQRFQRSSFAQKCYEQALGIYKARLGYDDPRVSRVLHNIGVMYHSKNANSVAMKCFLKSLSIRKAALGDNDISVAESHCWIGNIHRENEEFEAARESFVAAHRIKSLALGKDHPECAEILHNIGVVCDDLGLYSESLSSFREALVIRKANVSSAYDVNEMSDICDTLNCIANVYRATMDRQRALQFFEQSLKRRARIVSATLSDGDEQVSILLGTYEDVIALMKTELKESTDKSEIPGKIGSLLVEMGILYDHRLNKPTKALIYFQRALQVFKQMKDLKKIGQVLSHMASIHVKMADNQKALKCFRDALVLQQKSLKGESLEIADTLHNIGNCEAKDGEFEKCLDTYAESLRIKKNLLPAEHVSIAKTEHCIGLAQLQVGKNLDKALGYFFSSMKARRSLLGNNHLDVSFSLHSIGRIYFHQDKYEEAIDYVEQALKIKENALHERHISLAETQHLLGSLLIKKGSSSAVPLLKEALITYKGKKDCEVLKSDVLDLLATAYMKKGDNRYAILSLEQSLKIKTKILGPDDLACANVLMILGKLKAKTENVDGALVAFKEVKRIQKQVYGKEHLKNAELLVEVAAIQNQLGNSDVALRCYTEALRIRRAQLYINSPEIADVLVSLGKIHQTNDNHVSSVECFDEAVDIYSKKQNFPELADVYYLLGTSQLATGDKGNGLHSLEKCLQARGSVYGTNSDEWAEVAYDLGVAKLETDAKNGVSLLEKFVRIARTSEKDSSERLSNALVKLGKIYRKTRSIDEAMELFDEALEMQKGQDDNELWVSEVMAHKGSILESRKQYPKSLACYEESLRLRKSVVGEDEVTADIMKRVGDLHRLRGSYDQAAELFESALDVYRMTVGNDHESVADTLHCLGYIHDSKNDSDKALSYHTEAWNVRKAMFGKDHVKVASSLDDIAGIYQKLGDNVKAIKCLKEALRVRKLVLGYDDMEVATTLFGLGICCAAINETPKAMECYNRALEITSFDGSNPKLEAQALHQIGCIHASKCSYRDALQSWRTSLSKYREAGLADDHYMVACTLGNIQMAENILTEEGMK